MKDAWYTFHRRCFIPNLLSLICICLFFFFFFLSFFFLISLQFVDALYHKRAVVNLRFPCTRVNAVTFSRVTI